jgi:UPF0755 protein
MSRYDEEDDQPRRGWWSSLVMLVSWAVSAAVIVLGVAVGFMFETYRPGPATRTGADTIIVIPHGQGVSGIAQNLEKRELVRNALAFRVAAEMFAHGRKLLAGEYEIPSGASPRVILDKLVEGDMLLHPITVPEGWTSQMAVNLIASSDVLGGEAPPTPPEGSLLPETYNVERGAARAAVIKQMQDAHQKALAALWPNRAPGLPFRTPEEAVIMASIVEKETAVATERPRVAAVFINRLRKGMRLETDPTIIYGVCKADPRRCRDGRLVDEKTGETRGIRQSELAMVTGYNTYKIYGLPPTPIANPGRASLEAVLNPATTGDLYFVANGEGGHVFAASLAEHNQNVAKWRAIEKARGG